MDKKIVTSVDEMSFKEKNEDLQVKFIFTSINGTNNAHQDNLTIESADFIVLFHQKQ